MLYRIAFFLVVLLSLYACGNSPPAKNIEIEVRRICNGSVSLDKNVARDVFFNTRIQGFPDISIVNLSNFDMHSVKLVLTAKDEDGVEVSYGEKFYGLWKEKDYKSFIPPVYQHKNGTLGEMTSFEKMIVKIESDEGSAEFILYEEPECNHPIIPEKTR